jgi:hypothetical protein
LGEDATTLVKVLPGVDSKLDDIAMWNRSLSSAEIIAIYNGGNAGQNVSEVPPVLNPVLRLAVSRTGAQLTISASGSPASNWRIESRTILGGGAEVWAPVGNVTLGAAPVTLTQPIDGAQKFYRGVLLP